MHRPQRPLAVGLATSTEILMSPGGDHLMLILLGRQGRENLLGHPGASGMPVPTIDTLLTSSSGGDGPLPARRRAGRNRLRAAGSFGARHGEPMTARPAEPTLWAIMSTRCWRRRWPRRCGG